ncbi:MAG TPA: hypothetical protein VFR08_11325 [Candidatus Angelobacter sp.]|nr:hypothetical protein [Candidatus Angelobacter sp.]HKS73522.1 hypothetical protein [Terriglobales bacterium]
MNVTRQVITDLLPVYLSGEASEDTKTLVEDYFRQDPDFEHIARTVATPLETLRAAAPIGASPERKKRDLESIFLGLRRRKWLFGVSLFLTLSPLSFDFAHGHIVSLMLPQSLWHAAFDWSLAAVLWFVYFARMRLRTASLVCAISFTLIPIPFVVHSVSAGGRVAEFAIFWIAAAWIWFGYFRPRPC